MKLKQALKYVGLKESSYHYKPRSSGKKGKAPTSTTIHRIIGTVRDSDVVNSIKQLLSNEFIDCGYKLMTRYLQREGYLINHKKVYRIMGNAGLLKPGARIKSTGARKFVRFRKVNTKYPFECLEMDIKMIWIPDIGKNAYLFSVIDVHSRRILDYTFKMSIKKGTVINVLSNIIDTYKLPEHVVIRSDNGSQFIANNVREFLSLVGIQQEFTHVATPEENAHIEAFHGTLKRDVLDRFDYTSFEDINKIIDRYMNFYNNNRLHGRLGGITPMEKWNMDKHLIPLTKKAA
ncbi:MAG: IS3 family transposase [Hyphomicrobiales bacterium]